MTRERQMVAEFMYAAGQTVRHEPIDLNNSNLVEIIERRFSWMFEEVCETHHAQNLPTIADGLGDTIYVALGTSLELGVLPLPDFRTLSGFLTKVEQTMRVRGLEINYLPQTIRSKHVCDIYIATLIKVTSNFPKFTTLPLLTTSLEAIITTCCEFALYLGLPLSPIFDEIHSSNMTKFLDGHSDPTSGKWLKGPSHRPPNLDPLIFS